MKTSQLVLLPTTRSNWLLDEETKRIGRDGLAQAREVLRVHRITTVRDDVSLPIAA